MKCNPIFGFPIPVFPIQYASFTELSLTIRGVSYSLPCKMIALFGPLGVKGKIWSPWQIDPKGTHPPPKHVFGCTERKSTLLRNKKKLKKAREGATSSICPPHPHFRRPPYFVCGGLTVDIIKLARFQVNRFRGFGAPGSRKWPSSIDLAHRPYTCYNVI